MKVKIKFYKIFVFLQIIYFNPVFSQTIKGLVIDSSDNPIPYVNVIVINNNDSSYITGDNFPTGRFTISNINRNNFIVQVTLLGYSDKYIPVKTNLNDTINLGKIKLHQKKYQIQEIVVSEKAPLIKTDNGNLIINVNSTPLRNEESVTDLLRNAPGIIAKNDGEIEVFGKGKPLILINGKKILSESQLQMLKPSEIKNIEISKNLMGKYDASYKSVININTNTKNNSFGGQLYNNLKYSDLFVNNTNISFNENKNKLSLYLSYNYSNGKVKSWEDSKNTVYSLNNSYESSFDSKEINNNHKNNLFYACNYKLNNNTDVGIQGVSDFNNLISNNILLTNNITSSYQDYNIQNEIDQNKHNRDNGINLNYTNKHDSTSQLVVLADYSQYKDENSMMNNELTQSDKSLISSLGKINYNISSSQADYDRLIIKKLILMSLGIKYSAVKNSNNNVFTTVKDSVTSNDSLFNNKSLQQEEIGAAYLTLSKEVKKIKLSASIRTEYNKWKVIINNTEHKISPKIYLFPSFSLDYNINKNWDASLIYSKNINRTKYQTTSQEFIYVNPVLYIEGNPSLKNTISNNLSLNLLVMQFLNLELDYSKENNYYAMGFFNMDSIVVAKYLNYNRQKLYGSLYANVRNEKFSSNIGIYFSKLLFQYMYLDENQVPHGIGFTFSTTNIITIKKNLEFYFSTQYNNPHDEDFFHYKSTYLFDFGFRKYILKKSFRIGIYCTFNSSEHYDLQYNDINISHNYLTNQYMIYLTALYNFKFKNWEKQYSSQSEEKDRL